MHGIHKLFDEGTQLSMGLLDLSRSLNVIHAIVTRIRNQLQFYAISNAVR